MSWYEAVAFAEFSEKSLPTIYHWTRAAGLGLAAYVTPLSNFGGEGPAAVGSTLGVSRRGAYDMAGNVREWCWNELEAGQTRYILGGAWNDPDYMFYLPQALPSDQRQLEFPPGDN